MGTLARTSDLRGDVAPCPTSGRPAVVAAFTAALAALAGALLALAAAPAAALEAQGVRVDVADPSLFGHASFLRPAIPPGGTATYALQLRNQREQPVEVLVYGADLVSGTGDVASGEDNRSLGAWISAGQSRHELPPQGAVVVPVSITRPPADEDGGRGAIVVQLSEATRQELSLDRIERAALRVEVAADGSGDGVHAEVVDTDRRGVLLPGVLAVDVRFTDPGPQVPANAPPAAPGVVLDGAVVLSRPFAEDPAYDAPAEVLAGQEVTTTVEVELPFYGVVGHVRAEAAVAGLTTSSPPVRVLVVPPWLGLLLVALAAAAVLRARWSRLPFGLGRVSGRSGSADAAEDAGDADAERDEEPADDAGDETGDDTAGTDDAAP